MTWLGTQYANVNIIVYTMCHVWGELVVSQNDSQLTT